MTDSEGSQAKWRKSKIDKLRSKMARNFLRGGSVRKKNLAEKWI
jgi:hypothetical protein